MVGPGDEISPGAGGQSRLRASHADREQVIDALKAAFVRGRLTKAELDARVGQALAARTYADLAAVIAGIPVAPDLAPPVKPVRPQRPGNRAAKRAVKSGVGAITVVMAAASTVAVVLGQPGAAVILAVFIVILAAVATAFVASVIAAVVALESRRQKRSGGHLPPSAPGPDGQASQRTVPPDPPGQLPPADHRREYWSLTHRRHVPVQQGVRQPGHAAALTGALGTTC